MTKDYYSILGIPKKASQEEISKAYKNLAKKYHPDLNKEAGAEEKFKEVTKAYETLKDSKKREMYDRFGDSYERASGFSQGGFDFSDIFRGMGFDFESSGFGFSDFFGGQGFGTSERRQTQTYAEIVIEFMDAVKGKEIEVEIPEFEKCSSCNGTGQERKEMRSPFGLFMMQGACGRCGGTGKIEKKGKKEKVKIEIPAGVLNGERIKNKDIIFVVRIKPHKYYKRDGNDLYIEIPIGISEAMLGTEIEVPSPYGKEKLKIPANTNEGTILRIKGKGIKDSRNYVGDLYIKIILELPKNLSKKQKQILQDFLEEEKSSITEKRKKIFFN